MNPGSVKQIVDQHVRDLEHMAGVRRKARVSPRAGTRDAVPAPPAADDHRG